MPNLADPSAPRGSFLAIHCLALATGLALACSDGGSSTPQSSSSAKSQPASKAIAVEGEVPDSYPGDLPVYPGASAAISLGIPGAAMLVTFDSPDAVGQIVDFLNEELPKSGWSVESAAPDKLTAIKDDRKAAFTIMRNKDGGSKISVTLTPS